ncbi:MAG: hypothetical protein K8R87_13520, partial [Verrucomicrobia bacterium]|nr:hypothetical protein [Verrucomicrobiota bacterium]
PMSDKDALKRNQPLERLTSVEKSSQVFRNRFIEGKDAEIAKILWNYFTAVSQRWPKAWISGERGMVLARTTGFAALMRFLPDLIMSLDSFTRMPETAEFPVG